MGHTGNIHGRLRRHNTLHKGYTGRACDWEVVYTESYTSKDQAYKRERQVKAWKSKAGIIKLINNNFQGNSSDAGDAEGGSSEHPACGGRVNGSNVYLHD